MKIIDLNNKNISNNFIFNPSSIALGNFDGVHIAHRELLEHNIKISKKMGIKSSVLLFTNHTKEITKNEKPELLTTEEEKMEILKKIGIDIIYTMEFTDDVMSLSPYEFIEDIIIKKINAKHITVGFDYKFGYRAKGDAKLLKKLSNGMDIGVDIIKPIYKTELISSTKIREYLSLGKIEEANELLGYMYSLKGKVIHGNKRGRKMGYPTANMELKSGVLIPKPGIYSCVLSLEGKRYLSATNIGKNPTFNIDELRIENHILNFNERIYGKDIEISFIRRIRDEIKFNNAEELILQMKEDIIEIEKDSIKYLQYRDYMI